MKMVFFKSRYLFCITVSELAGVSVKSFNIPQKYIGDVLCIVDCVACVLCVICVCLNFNLLTIQICKTGSGCSKPDQANPRSARILISILYLFGNVVSIYCLSFSFEVKSFQSTQNTCSKNTSVFQKKN